MLKLMDKKLFTILQLTFFVYLDLCDMGPDQKAYFLQNYRFDNIYKLCAKLDLFSNDYLKIFYYM